MMMLTGCTYNADVRSGSSNTTVPTPYDFKDDYNYGSGRIIDFDDDLLDRHTPAPQSNETIRNTEVTPDQIQVLYLWEQDNMPSVTTPTYSAFDPPDFQPYITCIPVNEHTKVKGAVVLLAGGAFQIRGNYTDTLPTAAHLRELGFRTFIVDYRLRPYTQQEGALDVARAVRFIRQHADAYGIYPEYIAVMGYSAGGIQAGEFFLHFDEDIKGDVLDKRYRPDALDQIPARAAACGMIYSFYGRLSVASLDEEELAQGDLPPTFYCYGTEDPFYDQFEAQYDLIQTLIPVRRIVLDKWPHGFGGDGDWVEDYAVWLEQIFHANRNKI